MPRTETNRRAAQFIEVGQWDAGLPAESEEDRNYFTQECVSLMRDCVLALDVQPSVLKCKRAVDVISLQENSLLLQNQVSGVSCVCPEPVLLK